MGRAAGHAVAGVVGKAFGLRGEVYVRPDPDVADDFAPGRRYRVTATGGAPPSAPSASPPAELEVARSWLHSGRRVVRFHGVDDRAGAEALRGVVLEVARADLPADADRFWTDELLGRRVVDDRGAHVGSVAAVADGPAHDYLVVERPGRPPALVPAVADLVTVHPDRVVVTALPGLLDEGA